MTSFSSPGGGAHQLILKAGDEGTGAQLQGILLGLAALKGDAVLEALEVDDHSVAVLGGTLHSNLAGGPGDQGLHLVVDILSGDGDLSLGGLDALVLAQHRHGAQGDGGGEGEALLAQGLHLHGGIAHHIQAGLLDRLGQGHRIQIVDRILIEHVGTIHLLHQLAGGLALPEAGQGDHTSILAVDLLDGGVKFFGTHLDGQYSGVLFLSFPRSSGSLVSSS